MENDLTEHSRTTHIIALVSLEWHSNLLRLRTSSVQWLKPVSRRYVKSDLCDIRHCRPATRMCCRHEGLSRLGSSKESHTGLLGSTQAACRRRSIGHPLSSPSIAGLTSVFIVFHRSQLSVLTNLPPTRGWNDDERKYFVTRLFLSVLNNCSLQFPRWRLTLFDATRYRVWKHTIRYDTIEGLAWTKKLSVTVWSALSNTQSKNKQTPVPTTYRFKI